MITTEQYEEAIKIKKMYENQNSENGSKRVGLDIDCSVRLCNFMELKLGSRTPTLLELSSLTEQEFIKCRAAGRKTMIEAIGLLSKNKMILNTK